MYKVYTTDHFPISEPANSFIDVYNLLIDRFAGSKNVERLVRSESLATLGVTLKNSAVFLSPIVGNIFFCCLGVNVFDILMSRRSQGELCPENCGILHTFSLSLSRQWQDINLEQDVDFGKWLFTVLFFFFLLLPSYFPFFHFLSLPSPSFHFHLIC